VKNCVKKLREKCVQQVREKLREKLREKKTKLREKKYGKIKPKTNKKERNHWKMKRFFSRNFSRSFSRRSFCQQIKQPRGIPMTGLAGGCTPEDMFLGTLPRTPGNLGPPQEPRGHSHRPQRPSPGPRKPGGRPGIQRFPETPGTLPKIPGNQGTSQEPRGPPGPRDLPQDHGKPGPPLGSPGPSPQFWFPPWEPSGHLRNPGPPPGLRETRDPW
jgi:hypothetical protein